MNISDPALSANNTKRWLFLFPLVLGVAAVIALAQSSQFASSLWVIAQFGFTAWQEHITRMLHRFPVLAVLTGIIFLVQMRKTTLLSTVFRGAVSFTIGFAVPYLCVGFLTLLLYVPLGILSFIFSDQIQFTSLGFAFLCATYLVFLWIVIDLPSLFIHFLKNANVYFKFLALLVATLLVLQVLTTLLSIFEILVEHSVWRVELPAFILALGVSLLVTIFLNTAVFREGSYHQKIAVILAVYILSVITGNLSQFLFHWGEYPSAILTAFVAPLAWSYLFCIMLKDRVASASIVIGAFLGLGIGLLIAHFVHLRIIGQTWCAILCGASIAVGFGVSFGFILGPRIDDLLRYFFRVPRVLSIGISVGSILGIILGTLIGGFLNR